MCFENVWMQREPKKQDFLDFIEEYKEEELKIAIRKKMAEAAKKRKQRKKVRFEAAAEEGADG